MREAKQIATKTHEEVIAEYERDMREREREIAAFDMAMRAIEVAQGERVCFSSDNGKVSYVGATKDELDPWPTEPATVSSLPSCPEVNILTTPEQLEAFLNDYSNPISEATYCGDQDVRLLTPAEVSAETPVEASCSEVLVPERLTVDVPGGAAVETVKVPESTPTPTQDVQPVATVSAFVQSKTSIESNPATRLVQGSHCLPESPTLKKRSHHKKTTKIAKPIVNAKTVGVVEPIKPPVKGSVKVPAKSGTEPQIPMTTFVQTSPNHVNPTMSIEDRAVVYLEFNGRSSAMNIGNALRLDQPNTMKKILEGDPRFAVDYKGFWSLKSQG